jgi:hypothetical protein
LVWCKARIAARLLTEICDGSTDCQLREHIPIAEFQKGIRIFYEVLKEEW